MMPRKRWEAGTNPAEMVGFLYMKLTDRGARPERARKVALYVAALCRQVWDELPWICRTLVEITERAAEGEFDVSRLRPPIATLADRLWQSAFRVRNQSHVVFPIAELSRLESSLIQLGFAKPPDADDHVCTLTGERFSAIIQHIWGLAWPMRGQPRLPFHLHSLSLLWDIAGDPYRPTKFKPEWRTDTVLSLARQMYEAREFSAMPILADALQDAGCNHDAMLNHCRDTSLTHVRGCWVVDLVLGKE
jgi:hypothetical protein